MMEALQEEHRRRFYVETKMPRYSEKQEET
jgi:hypothetical protein